MTFIKLWKILLRAVGTGRGAGEQVGEQGNSRIGEQGNN
jgi:hypothetical protein